ncbi:MAG: ion channel [Caldilineaceae bacterium]|nr:ion channel [Caldilineaceae bacterium]
MTLTTVGYGDFSPVTTGGRTTAVVLMLGGIGVVSFIPPT